ncbi:MAG: DUF5618 family protein [Marinilabiliaceae bacterium]|nr:DUF5618 family protein [Marinilabiliaceae bacterium]
MSIQEQQFVKEKYYTEAVRYMDNAKGSLQLAKKEGKFYQDAKYVKTACGTAYSGLLVALDGYLMLKGINYPKKKVRKSIEFYQENISKIDKKMLDHLIGAYKILHLYGYYDGILVASVIKDGFDLANKIIEKIKPNVEYRV